VFFSQRDLFEFYTVVMSTGKPTSIPVRLSLHRRSHCSLKEVIAIIVRRRIHISLRFENIMEHLNIEFLTEQIIPYVGADQFRFVAGVNRTFYSAYTSVYNHPEHRTSYDFINTMELFNFCYQEMRNNEKEQRLLFQCAVKQGNLDALQYLHDIGCSWDVDVSTFAHAISFGHLDVLWWARSNGCP
jgi:hypothetical protein